MHVIAIVKRVECWLRIVRLFQGGLGIILIYCNIDLMGYLIILVILNPKVYVNSAILMPTVLKHIY